MIPYSAGYAKYDAPKPAVQQAPPAQVAQPGYLPVQGEGQTTPVAQPAPVVLQVPAPAPVAQAAPVLAQTVAPVQQQMPRPGQVVYQTSPCGQNMTPMVPMTNAQGQVIGYIPQQQQQQQNNGIFGSNISAGQAIGGLMAFEHHSLLLKLLNHWSLKYGFLILFGKIQEGGIRYIF